MRKIDRIEGSPTCLAAFKPGRQVWGAKEFNDCRREVRRQLKSDQRDKCAYCERSVVKDEAGHIEHFIRRGTKEGRPLTFTWTNLFWSCEDPKTCGKYKDMGAHGGYVNSDLVKPDVDNPAGFLAYRVTGEVVPKTGVDPSANRRAETTIRVFNLNPYKGSLVNRRATAFKAYLQELADLQEFYDDPAIDDVEVDAELDTLLSAIDFEEFSGSTRFLIQDALRRVIGA